MEKHNRGTKIPVTTIFYNSAGAIAQPTSANITFSYPSGSTDSDWPFDGSDRLTTTVGLNSISTVAGTWATTWDSAASANGLVFWSAVPRDAAMGINEGQFELLGNLANIVAVPSTA